MYEFLKIAAQRHQELLDQLDTLLEKRDQTNNKNIYKRLNEKIEDVQENILFHQHLLRFHQPKKIKYLQ
jgi:hypothetical protein